MSVFEFTYMLYLYRAIKLPSIYNYKYTRAVGCDKISYDIEPIYIYINKFIY